MRAERDWINTFTGAKFWPLDPRTEEVRIEDIAHALSLQCRFTGHIKRFYSVAEHSVRVAWLVPPADQAWALLHDASEAYLLDLARPVKHHESMFLYRAAEDRLMRVICDRFGLPHDMPASVHEADQHMLGQEAQTLLNIHPEWFASWPELKTIAPNRDLGWHAEYAENLFLLMFRQLNLGAAA